MTLEEARRIVADEDASDPIAAIEAVALVVRFEAIANRRLLPVAEEMEAVAQRMKDRRVQG